MPLNLSDNVQYLKGVGPSLAVKLNNLEIYTVEDLLYHFPRSYEDRRELKLLKDVREGERATFRFKVIGHSTFYYNGKTHPFTTMARPIPKLKFQTGVEWPCSTVSTGIF
ncbi:MAG: hypothetical protein AMS17_20670 [Spirochaetes bacterium DG_61]|nr:MAG: hypothetical protein AMS17_20670 [Spirochaetes bacterium DG_61]